MSTLRQQLEGLLEKTGRVSENNELDALMGTVLDGFVDVLRAANVVRELRGRQYRQQKAGEAYEATMTYSQLLKAEKIHEDLLKKWTAEMSRVEDTQTTLF